MQEVKNDRKLQREMHKDFFDRCRNAIDNGCYFEAVLMEYASIEARLEVIMGVIGLPCNKQLSSKERQSIKISKRIECLRRVYRSSSILKNAPIFDSDWMNLKDWIDKRNKCIHGLYKNEFKYKTRIKQMEELADNGYIYANLLYKEAKRLRGLLHNGMLSSTDNIHCGRLLCAYINNHPSKRL